jgi:hypothetical protein
MSVLDAIHLALDDALGFGALALTVSMTAALAVWFACSVAENVAKVGQRAFRPSYDALLRENERLRDSLADAREENAYLRSLYRDLPARAEEERQSAAWERWGNGSRKTLPAFEVDSETKIEVNGEDATLANVQVGDEVKVQVKAPASDTSLTARQLQVEDESAEDSAPAT